MEVPRASAASIHCISKAFRQGDYGMMLQLHIKENEKGASEISMPLQTLSSNYVYIFVEPKQLLLRRSHDHRIPPVPAGTNPTNNQPYRYPYFQKTEIEKIVR